MKLFSENLRLVETNRELVVLQKQFPNYDPGYICQATAALRQKEKEWIEKLWEQYEPYADSHFTEDFKRQFAQRSWELYFGATLLNHGFKLGSNRGTGPDFDVRNENDERLSWVEAISIEQGNGNDRVPDMIWGVVQNVPEEEMMLRITNALDKKFKKYQAELKKDIIKNEPYVLAINRSNIGFLDPVIPLILKVLFGIGHLTLKLSVNGVKQENPESFWSGRPSVAKKSGENIPMLFFVDQAHAGISAIIYSVNSILNSPHTANEMGENFVIVHNPLARNPLPDGFFPFGDEYKVQGDQINKIRQAKVWNRNNLF